VGGETNYYNNNNNNSNNNNNNNKTNINQMYQKVPRLKQSFVIMLYIAYADNCLI
jgi:hypothetical protein